MKMFGRLQRFGRVAPRLGGELRSKCPTLDVLSLTPCAEQDSSFGGVSLGREKFDEPRQFRHIFRVGHAATNPKWGQRFVGQRAF